MSDPIREFFDRDAHTDGPRVIFTFGSHGEAIGALNAARAATTSVPTALAAAQAQPAGTRETVAAFLKDRDEALLPGEHTDEERLESADHILALINQITPSEVRTATLMEAADLADTTFDCNGTDAAHIIRDAILAKIGKPALPPARKAAARLLLNMLHMRNGAHEGVTKDDAQAMWEAASTREGYGAVDAFLRSIIGEERF